MMSEKSIQDFYPDDVDQCYGCGRANEHGLQQPRPYHTAIPGYVYGGLIASLKVDFLRPTALGPRPGSRGADARAHVAGWQVI